MWRSDEQAALPQGLCTELAGRRIGPVLALDKPIMFLVVLHVLVYSCIQRTHPRTRHTYTRRNTGFGGHKKS